MSGLFSLDKVKISYGKNEIVHGVSMDIAKGEFCALLGLNGSGKTTILHALLRISANGGQLYSGRYRV